MPVLLVLWLVSWFNGVIVRATPRHACEPFPLYSLISFSRADIPEEWRHDEKIHFRTVSVLPTEEKGLRACALVALRAFPTRVIAAELRRVVVVSKLEFYDVAAGGTNSSDVVIITALDAEGMPRSCDSIKKTFLHELSSILLRNHPGALDTAAWNRVNPPEFSYYVDAIAAVRADPSLRHLDVAGPTDLRAGFLTRYSRSSFEDDFNMLSEYFLTEPARIGALAHDHEALRAKVKLTIAFYRTVSPETEDLCRLCEKGFARPADDKPKP